MAKRKAVFIDQPEPKAQTARQTGPPTPGRDSMLGHWRLWPQCPPEKRINQALAPHSSVLRVCCDENAATYTLQGGRSATGLQKRLEELHNGGHLTRDGILPLPAHQTKNLLHFNSYWRRVDGAQACKMVRLTDSVQSVRIGPCSVQTDVTVSQ